MTTMKCAKSPEYIWNMFESRIAERTPKNINFELQDKNTQIGMMNRNFETSIIFYQISASEKQNVISTANGLIEETEQYDDLMQKFASNIVISGKFLAQAHFETRNYEKSLRYIDLAKKFVNRMGMSQTESNSYKKDLEKIRKDVMIKMSQRD